jgi:5-methylthioadenosine/S-adenosylhomocysteine deaminase
MTTTPEACDLLIEAGFVVPVEPHGVVLENHAVAIRDGLIIGLLPIHEARQRYLAAEIVARPDGALICR